MYDNSMIRDPSDFEIVSAERKPTGEIVVRFKAPDNHFALHIDPDGHAILMAISSLPVIQNGHHHFSFANNWRAVFEFKPFAHKPKINAAPTTIAEIALKAMPDRLRDNQVKCHNITWSELHLLLSGILPAIFPEDEELRLKIVLPSGPRMNDQEFEWSTNGCTDYDNLSMRVKERRRFVEAIVRLLFYRHHVQGHRIRTDSSTLISVRYPVFFGFDTPVSTDNAKIAAKRLSHHLKFIVDEIEGGRIKIAKSMAPTIAIIKKSGVLAIA